MKIWLIWKRCSSMEQVSVTGTKTCTSLYKILKSLKNISPLSQGNKDATKGVYCIKN